MADIIIDQQTQIKYTVKDGDTEFVDALYYPVDQPPTNEEVAAEIERRYNNWIAPVYPDSDPIDAADVVSVLEEA